MARRLLILALLFGAIGCGSKQPDSEGPPPSPTIGAGPDSASSETPLVGTYWRIVTLDSLTVPVTTDTGPRAPHLQLTESGGTTTYSTTVGCNGIGGDATISGDALTFGPGIGTKMFCEALNALEVQLHSVLTRTRRYSIAGTTLELRDQAGARIATLEAGPR
jgi:heat shock protein HslJ